MHRSCYSGLMYTSFTNHEINYFRELRRSGVKTWLHTIGEEDDISAEKVLAHPLDSHIDILSKWGLLHDEVDILEHVTICGSSYRGNQTQVLLHVDAARRQHFGILNLIIRKKNSKKYLFFVQDQKVLLLSHLGLYQLLDTQEQLSVINFSDLTSAEPLNIYTGKNCDGEDVHLVSLKEGLLYEC